MPSLEFRRVLDRKSTRLNSSHGSISYAVFCLKKKIRLKQKQSVHSIRTTVPLAIYTRSRRRERRSATVASGCMQDPVYRSSVFFFFFNDTATTEIYPLSLPDALPI